jgi:hypothetical protein
MIDYNSWTVAQLKTEITDKEDFFLKSGCNLSSARKNKLVEYLNQKNGISPKIKKSSSETDLTDLVRFKPQNPNPPKVDKNFIPDPSKLEKIRETIPPPELPVRDTSFVTDQMKATLDEEDINKLSNILDPTSETVNLEYVYNENAEVKCKKYCELYPQIKPILNSPDFKSSEEKLKYVEQYINSTRTNMNILDYLFIATTYVERNKQVNNYIKLRGYTGILNRRRSELESYIEELKIKYMDDYGEYLNMPVEARIALIFAETAITVHMTNTQKDIEEEVKRQPRDQQKVQPPTMN